jgi:iron complex outermembrane receptor protein
MSTPQLKSSLIALAVAQAFAGNASAQSTEQKMPEVVISAAKTAPLDRASVGGFSDAPLQQTPASITVIGREQMQEFRIRQTTDAMLFDASVSDSYNAVGYAEQFSIRGFNLDNASSYRKDGLAIPGDTQIALENKERIEILKGLAALQAGVASPGGIVNYVTKRPTNADLRSVTLEASERGTLYGAVDLGGRGSDKRFGYRINAAGERIRSQVKGADGERQFVSAAFDWQLSPQALLQLDLDYQHKEQITAPGYQLIGGTRLPTGISADKLLNDQPWTKPVDTTSSNIGLRFEYLIDADWRATVTANKHNFKRDDYTAFPYGCTNDALGEYLYPGYCSNGDYDVYTYESLGESKSPFSAQALLQGKFATGALTHELTLGAAMFDRHDKFGDYVYDYAGSSNIYHSTVVPIVNAHSGPVTERRTEHERSVFAQDIMALSKEVKLHAGLRYVSVERAEAGATKSHHFMLPSVAIVYSPTQAMSLYSSFAHGMEHGTVAGRKATNANVQLDPSRSKQLEFGVKAALGEDLNVTASVFEIRKGLEYDDLNVTNYNNKGVASHPFVRNGEATNRGLELAAQFKASADLNVGATLTALSTRQQGTGQKELDGKRVTDVPTTKLAAYAEYRIAAVPGLSVNGVWQYVGKKAFDLENTVMVPDYHLVNLGTSYATRIGGTATTIRANVNNAFNKFYWRDVTPQLGGYLIPGQSRSFKLSAQFDF